MHFLGGLVVSALCFHGDQCQNGGATYWLECVSVICSLLLNVCCGWIAMLSVQRYECE